MLFMKNMIGGIKWKSPDQTSARWCDPVERRGFVTGFFLFSSVFFSRIGASENGSPGIPIYRTDAWRWWNSYISGCGQRVHAITYDNVEAMGECKFYHWLDNPDPVKIDKYVLQNEGGRMISWLSLDDLRLDQYGMVQPPYRLSSWMFFCWENLSNFMCFMGKELQPSYEPCLLSKIMNALEAGNSFRSRRLMKSMEKNNAARTFRVTFKYGLN